MVANRLSWFLESRGLLNEYQSGFRKNHSTLDHILRLSDVAQRALSCKKQVLAVFLDFQKAYDMVWHAGLLYKIKELGISGNMFHWIRNFLMDHTICVRVDA